MKFKPVLIVGLGNPEGKYADTYHNVGFKAIDYLADSAGYGQKSKFQKSLSKNFEYLEGSDNLVFVKPLVFMNRSGAAVKSALNYFRIKPDGALIIHDDSDIELGEYKLSFGRNSAGHRGVDSVIKSLGTKNFWRLRIGIRKPSKTRTRIKAGDLVLKKISKKEIEIIKDALGKIKKLWLKSKK